MVGLTPADERFRKALGARLRDRRIALSLTLSDVAKATKVSESNISRYELGDQPVPPEVLARLARRYRCKTAEFFEGLPK